MNINTFCSIHRQSLNYFCVIASCHDKRILCMKCKEQQHRNHGCVIIDQLDDIANPRQYDGKQVQQSIKKMYRVISEYKKNCEKKSQILSSLKDQLYNILGLSLNSLDFLLKGILSSRCRDQHSNTSVIQSVAQLLRFLNLPGVSNSQQLAEIIDVVSQKAKNIIKNWNIKMDNSISEMNYQISKLVMGNWYQIYNKNKEQIQKIRNLKLGQPHSFRSFSSTKSQKSQFSLQENQFREVERYSKYVIKSYQNQQINKKTILNQLQNIYSNRIYHENLKELTIETPSQFDLEYLKKIVKFFPKLKNLNFKSTLYLNYHNYLKQSIFGRKKQPQYDKIVFSTNQETFDCFGQLKYLQNLHIEDPTKFQNRKINIKNQNITHLTVGHHKPRERSQIQQILKSIIKNINPLITLNLFNIKNVKDSDFKKILQVNKNSLQNLWICNWDCILSSTLQYLGNTCLQKIIIQKIAKIKHQISIPNTIKTLIVEESQIYTSVPFRGLLKAKNILNFSIGKNIFHSKQNIGDNVIKSLSLFSIPYLLYLNVEGCQTVTNQSLVYLSKLSKLKQLCINNTKIELSQLTKQKWIANLQKLAIVGLKDSNPHHCHGRIIQTILYHAQKLKMFYLTYLPQLYTIRKISYGKLKHICFYVINPRQQFLKDLMQELINMNLDIYIINQNIIDLGQKTVKIHKKE